VTGSNQVAQMEAVDPSHLASGKAAMSLDGKASFS